MKSVFILGLFSLSLCNSIINRNFVEQLKKIAPYQVYEPEENPFRDWTTEEIKNMLLPPVDEKVFPEKNIVINEGYDFREDHPECMLGIKDQQRCGSCWAFSGVMALQQRICLKSNGEFKPVLSAQDPVSCDKGNHGCSGGIPYLLWNYLESTGVVEEDCLPYSAGQGQEEPCEEKCKNGAEWKKWKAKDAKVFASPEVIIAELTANGPIQCVFNVYDDFMQYKGGIYEHISGALGGGHAVVTVGYGQEDGINYWICQNSWGPNWGEEGFFRIKFGQCAIDAGDYAGIPIL